MRRSDKLRCDSRPSKYLFLKTLKQDTPHSEFLKKDEVDQDRYDILIARIHMHCQRLIQNALRCEPNLFEESDSMLDTILDERSLMDFAGWVEKEKDYVCWNDYQRKSFIALKKDVKGQISFAFPPATEQQIRETEQQLGFSLPPLLRLLYIKVANGGFGPGYGITGAIGGYPAIDHLLGNIARRYQWEIDFADALRQLDKGGWTSLTPKGRQVLWEDGIGSQALWEAGQLADYKPEEGANPLQERHLHAPWPKQLLPLCEHGCNITTYIFADTERVVQGMHNPYLVVAVSLEEWFERWLDGEELQLM